MGWGNLGFFLHAEAVGGAGGGGVLEYSDASWPECGEAWGDSDRYDLIVDSGRRLWRVQVKSTRYMGERRFSITARGCTAAYTEDEIDFLAVYIVPLDIWYVIPVKAFAPRKCLRFYPEDEGSLGRYEKYREAWWLMKGEEAPVSG